MKNIITFGIIAFAIGFVLIVVLAFSIIVSINGIIISYAQSGYPPGFLQGQILSQQANLPNTQGQILSQQANLPNTQGLFIPPGSPTVLERVLSSNGQQIITICHQPPGNPANRHTIQISSHALDAHLAHGDTIGTCNDINAGNGQQIITICHQPPGNPANRHTIQISIHALNAHLAHGDTIDVCTR